MKDPRVHHLLDVVSRGLRECLPEVVCLGVPVEEPVEVNPQAFLHLLGADERGEHADHSRTLRVRHVVEDLVDLVGPADRDVDGVGPHKRVGGECSNEVSGDVTLPDLPLWVKNVAGHVLHVCRKAFVEPNVVPPLHCHEVPEPLMCCLVGNHYCGVDLVRNRTLLLVNKKSGLSVCDKSPVPIIK